MRTDPAIYQTMPGKTILNMLNKDGERPEIMTRDGDKGREFFVPGHPRPIRKWQEARTLAVATFRKAGFKAPRERI